MSAQPPSLGLIASHISRDLCDPEFLGLFTETSSERSHPAVGQQPTVPEIAVNEYHYARGSQDYIGATAKNLSMSLKSDLFPAQRVLQPLSAAISSRRTASMRRETPAETRVLGISLRLMTG